MATGKGDAAKAKTLKRTVSQTDFESVKERISNFSGSKSSEKRVSERVSVDSRGAKAKPMSSRLNRKRGTTSNATTKANPADAQATIKKMQEQIENIEMRIKKLDNDQ